jgi:NAD(P)-dependent dehydrogenase (short-subunit alcohol dehydrogenase family)
MILKNKIALVTGGAQGIGKAIAIRFAQDGAKVAICGLESDDFNDVVSRIEQFGGEVYVIHTDVSRKEQVELMIDKVMQRWEGIHIVVNNAGICTPASFFDITEEQWDQHFAVNVKGAFLVGQCAARIMVKHRIKGTMINISSVNGLSVEADVAHYNATKGALNLLTKSMALELADYDIRVNALCPGFIQTRLTLDTINNPAEVSEYLKTIPMKRVGMPEDIADAALFLATDGSRYMTGHCMVVDGGQMIKLA